MRRFILFAFMVAMAGSAATQSTVEVERFQYARAQLENCLRGGVRETPATVAPASAAIDIIKTCAPFEQRYEARLNDYLTTLSPAEQARVRAESATGKAGLPAELVKLIGDARSAANGTSTASSPPVTPAVRANMRGPTVAQIRAFILDQEHRAPGSRPLGPVEPWAAGDFRYRYAFPNGDLAIFGKCGSDQRCDQAVLVSALGKRGREGNLPLRNTLYAYNGLYVGDPKEQFRVIPMDVFGRPDDFALVQAFFPNDRSAASIVHSRYSAFVTVARALRDDLAKAAAPAASGASSGTPATYPGACDPRMPTANANFICMEVGGRYVGSLRKVQATSDNPYEDSVRFFARAGQCVRVAAAAGPGRPPLIQYVWGNLAAYNAESGGPYSVRFGRVTGTTSTGFSSWREWDIPHTGWHRARFWSPVSRMEIRLSACQ